MDAGRGQRVGQGRGTDQFQGCVDALRCDAADLVGYRAVVEDRVVDAMRREGVEPIMLAGGCEYGRADIFGQCGGGEAER